MSQIEFTSACAGDIGVTLNDEMVCILFIKMDRETHTIYAVDVHDIRKGGYPKSLPTLAAGIDHMLVLADNYRTADIERAVEEHIAAKKAFGRAALEGRFTGDTRHPNLIMADYFASNKEHS